MIYIFMFPTPTYTQMFVHLVFEVQFKNNMLKSNLVHQKETKRSWILSFFHTKNGKILPTIKNEKRKNVGYRIINFGIVRIAMPKDS